MGKFAEFMDKVKTDEALQKELAEIIGDGGAEHTKEQKEKTAELATKLGIELDVEGELSDEALGNIVGGLGAECPVQWMPFPPLLPTSTMEWKTDTYRCKNCGKTKKVSLAESGYLRLENDCPVRVLGGHEYEKIE